MNDSAQDGGAAGPLDVRQLRRTLGTFVTGVTVVTTVGADGQPRGMTANSFTSVSLDPPLVLVCVATAAGSFPAFRRAGAFAVNILAEGQEQLAARFAASGPDKFTGVAWSAPGTGAPVLDDSLAWLDCTVHSRSRAGDHMILIGRVEGMAHRPARPLAYSRGGYATVTPGPPPAPGHPTKRLLAGWIVERDGQILLVRADDTPGAAPRWTIPTGPLPRQYETADAIDAAARQSIGPGVNVEFLYAALDLPDQEALCLVYRGQAAGPGAAHPRTAGFAPAAIPWELIADRHIRNMLRRYLQERPGDSFGIYLGSPDDGRIAMVGPHRPWAVHARALTGIEPADPRPGPPAPEGER